MNNMKTLVAVLALALAGSGVAWADGIPQVQDAVNEAKAPWTMTVYNDSGAEIPSGEIVVWDTGDTDVSISRRPYVIQSATADTILTAGVTLGTCPVTSTCEIVVYGPALVRCLDAADAVGQNTTVGQSATDSGLCGDFADGSNTASLGVALAAGNGTDYEYIPVFINITPSEE